MTQLETTGQRAKIAGRTLATAPTERKNAALLAIAAALTDEIQTEKLLAVNAAEREAGHAAGLSPSLLDRMLLTPAHLATIANDVRTVAALPDPVGREYDANTLPNGLRVSRRRVPLGVVGVVYEARPNVTADCAALCLKSGNAAILRAGKEITRSSMELVAIIQRALADAGLPADAIQAINNPDRALVQELLKLDRYVDVIIPRGGAALHQFCREHATMPVITGGIGVCHVYVDAAADLAKVVPIVQNAKVQRPSVCNALDTLLVHRAVAPQILPSVTRALLADGVALRYDEEALAVVYVAGVDDTRVHSATADDFGTEFMALKLSARVVDSLDTALEHIARYGDHSDAIITEDAVAAERFVASVDSAAVFVNASTRFNDGAQLGLGAEIAVSTQKLHVRGPMALEELTSYKWVVRGNGQVRG